MFYLMAQIIIRSFRYSPFLHPPLEESVPLLSSLCNPIIPLYHVIFPFLWLFGIETFRLNIEGCKLVFRLSAVSEVGIEIPFGLRILKSFWILLPAVEGEELYACNACVGSVATRFLLGF
jgi:uncharacterized RDD family membrane protein YckC